MPNSKRTTYKGYCIMTKWTVLPRHDRRRSGFDAAFAVSSIVVGGESWQEFPVTVFDTAEAAEANALGAAQRSIDGLILAPLPRLKSAY